MSQPCPAAHWSCLSCPSAPVLHSPAQPCAAELWSPRCQDQKGLPCSSSLTSCQTQAISPDNSINKLQETPLLLNSFSPLTLNLNKRREQPLGRQFLQAKLRASARPSFLQPSPGESFSFAPCLKSPEFSLDKQPTGEIEGVLFGKAGFEGTQVTRKDIPQQKGKPAQCK